MTIAQTIKERWPRTIMIIILTALGVYSCAVGAQPHRSSHQYPFEQNFEVVANQARAASYTYITHAPISVDPA